MSIEGRTSDLAGLALISPRAEAGGRTLEPTISALAPRFPILLEAGKGDSNAASLAETLEPIIGRQRLSQLAMIETRLPATNLIRFAPEATRPLMSFLDNVVKIRADEWEPRYNLDPVLFANVRIINLGQGQEADGAPAARTIPEPEPGPAPAAAAPPADGDAPEG